jgi:hypothetical protein
MKWRLLQYLSSGGRGAIDDWRKSLPVNPQQADLDTFLKMMVKLDKWEYPHIKPLTGPHAGLTELRWKSGGLQHRIVGYRTGEHEYLMLVGCTHRGKQYNPSDALNTARRRKQQIEQKEALSNEYKLLTSE